MVELREPDIAEAAAIAELLNRDIQLRADLRCRDDFSTSAEGVLGTLAEWCQAKRAVSYAILADGVAVGVISLSQIDPMTRAGRIGYWVGSAHRRRGHCQAAFELVLREARRRGLREVSASIRRRHLASQRLWESFGATPEPKPTGHLLYTLSLRSVVSDQTSRDRRP